MIINPYRFGPGGPTDPDFASVVALLHFDGSDGSTTFTDVIGSTWTGGGSDPAIDTAQSVYGGASGEFIASSIATPDSAAWNLATFTVEFWMRANDVTTGQVPTGNRDGSSLGWEFFINNSGTGAVQFVGDGSVLTTANSVISINTWHHIAVAGTAGSTCNLYVDGVCRATGNIASISDSGTSLFIGRRPTGGFQYTGHIDDYRITNGAAAARYTGSSVGTTYFTPPAAAHPDS